MIAIAEDILVDEIVDGCAGNGGLEDAIVADHPRRHVSAVRPAADADAIRIDESALLQGLDTGHDVASGSGARIVEDRAREGVAGIVTAAIVRLEDHPALGRERLRNR